MNDRSNLIKVWTEAKYGEGISFAEREIFPRFLEVAKSSGKILEVGVGDGRMVKLLQKNGVQASFYSLDITRNVKNAPGQGIIADARYLPFNDNSFDLVYSLGVVEHFPETFRAIREQARIVRKGGKVLLTVPRLSLHSISRWIYYFRSGCHKLGSYEIVKGRNMRIAETRYYFHEAGLRILELRPTAFTVWLTPDFRINRYVERILPSERFGAFLFCLAEKR